MQCVLILKNTLISIRSRRLPSLGRPGRQCGSPRENMQFFLFSLDLSLQLFILGSDLEE